MRRAPSGSSSSSSSDNADVINSVRRKLRDSRTKIATIVHRCELLDRKRTGIVNIDDLEDIFNDVLGAEHRVTRRELIKFADVIMDEKKSGRIDYEKMAEALEPGNRKEVTIEENWRDEDTNADEGDTRWATQPGKDVPKTSSYDKFLRIQKAFLMKNLRPVSNMFIEIYTKRICTVLCFIVYLILPAFIMIYVI